MDGGIRIPLFFLLLLAVNMLAAESNIPVKTLEDIVFDNTVHKYGDWEQIRLEGKNGCIWKGQTEYLQVLERARIVVMTRQCGIGKEEIFRAYTLDVDGIEGVYIGCDQYHEEGHCLKAILPAGSEGIVYTNGEIW